MILEKMGGSRLRAASPIMILFCALLCLVPSGCAPQKDPSESDLSRLERNLTDIRNFQAEQTSEIAAVQGKLRELSGRVEELEYLQGAKLGTDISTLKRDLSTLQKRVPPPPLVPEITLEADEALARKLTNTRVSELFATALFNLRSGKYREALPKLQQAYNLNHGASGTVEILFWKGVAYDGIGDNRKALAAYAELISSFPKHKRKALALLRQGSVLIRLGDTRTAEFTFKKLIAEYPRTTEAARAKERLKDLR